MNQNSKIKIFRDGKFNDLDSLKYENEKELQKLIFDNPSLLKDELLILAREFESGNGPIDAIAIDRWGDFYIIEVKLEKNSDRRKIIAQLIDYGSSILSKTLVDRKVNEAIKEKWFDSLFERINNSMKGKFKEIIKQKFKFDDKRYKDFFDNFKQNLVEDKAIYYIVMDNIEETLIHNVRLLHSYLSKRYSIVLFEIKKYRNLEGFNLYCSSNYDFELIDDSRKSSKRSKWNEERFFGEVESSFKKTPEDVKLIRDFYHWCKSKFDEIPFGSGSVYGSFNPKLRTFSNRSVFTIRSNGVLYLHPGWWDYQQENKNKVKELKKKFGKLFGIGEFESQHVRIEFEEWKENVEKIKQILLGVLELK